ncbi:MAG: hypothetical protein CL610_06210 [Anaerolineaceae bacterium]|nr:hypothetical protein [Anaerolineaceae bacterium]
MPGPTLTFGFLLATLYGAGFHFLIGGDIRRLALFLLSAWVGFSLGHVLGVMLTIDIMNIGTLRVASATLGAFTALVVAHVLTSGRRVKS